MNVVVRQTSAMAIVSLVAGILGWTLIPVLGSVCAIITGHLARAEIRRNPQGLEGDGLAIGGLILGWLAAAMWVIGIAIFVLFFGGLAWLAAANS
ncbi:MULTISPECIES: DUF4190 domain-containing protein [Xanthomonas]|uniref:DUF4190 domain-containing protein n=1 Tax=Xanthomonas dyei TaxID=743699 RepID=A0ABZ0DI86_9XANT|nr:DUF4190 domain-containing protein [Xanthomonas dyei]WOB28294.1 DUF4190 domain-containing protein [Xanthomonas dyei]WOB55916.1 DUF4190 domain-containing protein [Xanthomonas dyei]